MVHFNEFLNGETNLSIITSDTIDDYILWLRENTEANDITINSYLRSVRAFLYYCMDCNYIPTFKIQLIKAEKKIKETYTDEELQRLLVKPDTNNCTFSCYKTWVFENYLLATGNRISTALNVRICDINFEDGTILTYAIQRTVNSRLYHYHIHLLTYYKSICRLEVEKVKIISFAMNMDSKQVVEHISN